MPGRHEKDGREYAPEASAAVEFGTPPKYTSFNTKPCRENTGRPGSNFMGAPGHAASYRFGTAAARPSVLLLRKARSWAGTAPAISGRRQTRPCQVPGIHGPQGRRLPDSISKPARAQTKHGPWPAAGQASTAAGQGRHRGRRC